jgi:uncharacterized membrane protein (UPF0127 family)
MTWLRRACALLLVVGVVACAEEAGNGPADPTLLPPGVTTTERTPLPGFGEVAIQVTKVDGEVVSWCLLLADTEELRQRGLMTVTDPTLGGYDGMLFRFDAPSVGGFWMRNTPQPLSLAYLGDDGGLVSTAEMAPCEDSPDCPNYAPSGPYVRSIEVPQSQGGVAALGIEPGAVVADLGRPCSESDGT